MRYWKRVNVKGETTTVESYSHDGNIEGAIEIDKTEHDDYIASLPEPVQEPVRDLGKEVDDLKVRLDSIESQIPFTTE